MMLDRDSSWPARWIIEVVMKESCGSDVDVSGVFAECAAFGGPVLSSSTHEA